MAASAFHQWGFQHGLVLSSIAREARGWCRATLRKGPGVWHRGTLRTSCLTHACRVGWPDRKQEMRPGNVILHTSGLNTRNPVGVGLFPATLNVTQPSQASHAFCDSNCFQQLMHARLFAHQCAKVLLQQCLPCSLGRACGCLAWLQLCNEPCSRACACNDPGGRKGRRRKNRGGSELGKNGKWCIFLICKIQPAPSTSPSKQFHR